MSDLPDQVKEDMQQSIEIITFFERYAEIMIDKMVAGNPDDDKKTVKQKFLYNCGVTFDDCWSKIKGLK